MIMRFDRTNTGFLIFKNSSGAALVYLIGVILVMSVLGAAMLNLTTTSIVGQVSANHTQRAYYMAEAGINYVLFEIGKGREAGSLNGEKIILNQGSEQEGQFSITVDDSNVSQTRFTVVGTIGAAVSAPARASLTLVFAKTINPGGPSIISRSIFSGGELELGKNVQVYGDIGTNDSEIKKGKGILITGNEQTNAGQTLESINFTCDNCNSDEEIKNNTTWNTGTLEYEKLKIKKNVSITIAGEVIIKVQEDFTVEKNTRFIFLPGASLTIYVDKKAEFKENMHVVFSGGTPRPEDFVLYGTKNADEIKIEKNILYNGVIYAPDAKIEIKENVHFTGALVGKEVKIEKNVQVTWDSDASTVTAGGSGGGAGTGGATLSNPSQYYSL